MRKNVSMLLTAAIVVMTLLMASCKEDSRLKRSIQEAKKECPVSIGMAGEMTDISYDEATNTVVIHYLMDEKLFNIDVMRKNTELLKEMAYGTMATAEGSFKQALDEMLGSGANLKLCWKGKESGKEMEFTLTSEEINKARKSGEAYANPLKMLENAISVTNQQAPMAVDEATTMTKLSIQGDFATYEYQIDETKVPFHKLVDMRDQMKENMRNAVFNNPDPAFKDFINLCKKANKGIAYKYVGMQSGNTCTIEFSLSEL